MMPEVIEYGVLGFLVLGVVLMLIAAIGLLRMPDLYLRTSVTSKGATLGIAALMLAVALHFGELGTSSRALAVIIFMMITAPVAAHMLGRAAYRSQVPFAQATLQDPDTTDELVMVYPQQTQTEPMHVGNDSGGEAIGHR
jgi:multicomponent Na+:H+ antiporter subunit G